MNLFLVKVGLGLGFLLPWYCTLHPLYPGQPQFPAHRGGGHSFHIYPHAIATPTGGNRTMHVHPLAQMLSPENLDPMQAITSSLFKLMELVTQSNQPSDSKTKPCEPETFDGSNPKKLQQCLVLLKLKFEARP